ncbi:hypothetical protein CEXT_442531 [Caerostris extrusa]|uniref:Uncharacterized protein n=1 Tax=Caerostris extrusa TaxID=172846 RepID=A0AAV4P4E6_CAEEX|nr:hypothetical protein CEXT_442531 [Caerostris extrusa]
MGNWLPTTTNLDRGQKSIHFHLVNRGSTVTMQMRSDALANESIAQPGLGLPEHPLLITTMSHKKSFICIIDGKGVSSPKGKGNSITLDPQANASEDIHDHTRKTSQNEKKDIAYIRLRQPPRIYVLYQKIVYY